MGKGGSAAGGDGGGSGGGEGAAVVGLDGLAILFLPFFTIASDSTTCGDRMGGGGTIPKGMINFLARLNFTPGKCYDAQTPNHMKKRYETKILCFDHPPLDTTLLD
jgi:hypothetical protein